MVTISLSAWAFYLWVPLGLLCVLIERQITQLSNRWEYGQPSQLQITLHGYVLSALILPLSILRVFFACLFLVYAYHIKQARERSPLRAL